MKSKLKTYGAGLVLCIIMDIALVVNTPDLLDNNSFLMVCIPYLILFGATTLLSILTFRND